MTDAESQDGHGKCGAIRNGNNCGRPAGWGTNHPGIGYCKLHGGSTPTHERSAQLVIARRECDRLGIPIEVDAGEALIAELWETEGNLAFYRALVQELPTHPAPDVFVPAVEMDDGERIQAHWERGEPGVYGRTYHVSGMPTGEAKPHILVQLYNDERKHRASVAAAALKAGVEERRIRMVEADAGRVLGAQIEALKSIGMGDRLEDFRRAFVAALRPMVEQRALGDSGAI
jgi:hypothetical protein